MLLALLFLILPLASCDGGSGDDVDGGGIGDDGTVNWDEVDFKGTTLKFAVSENQNAEVTFGASNVYLQGTDESTTDEVLKKVKERNTKVENDLNLKVEYIPIDEWYDGVFNDIEMKVLGSSEDAPDLYNNDMYGLNPAILAGYLMNVKNPLDATGQPTTSYFNFNYDGWNMDFMEGATFDSSKVYLLVGDYHIDVIRMAWVFYVNKTMFNQNASSLGLGVSEISDFYDYVLDGIWDWDMMSDLSDKIWQDNGSIKNTADEDDGRVGLAINHVSEWIFESSTGLTTFQMGEDGRARVIDGIDEYQRMASSYRDNIQSVKTADGVYYYYDVISSTNCFIKGNFLFAHAVLGEMESKELRDVTFEKGLVPVPKYHNSRQEEYHTMIHDQAEVTAVLVTTSSFGRASAFMQYVNEESRPVLTEYYEFALKFKYNEDPDIRNMIDLVYNSIDNPFGMQFQGIIMKNYADTGVVSLRDGLVGNTVSQIWDGNKTAYSGALDKAFAAFNKLP